MLINYHSESPTITEKIDGENMHFIAIPHEVISKVYIGCRAKNAAQIISDIKNHGALDHVSIIKCRLDGEAYKLNYKKIL